MAYKCFGRKMHFGDNQLNFYSCEEILLFYHNQFLYEQKAYRKMSLRKHHLEIAKGRKVHQRLTSDAAFPEAQTSKLDLPFSTKVKSEVQSTGVYFH